jgi:hypothetical protein
MELFSLLLRAYPTHPMDAKGTSLFMDVMQPEHQPAHAFN